MNNTQTITLTKQDKDRFLNAIFLVMLIDFKHFLESQPVVFTALGTYIQRTKDEGTIKALNDFINAVRSVNSLAISCAKNQYDYMDLEELLYSIPLADEPTE